jgi:hypothetical protein
MKNLTLKPKLLLIVGGAIAISLLITSLFTVNYLTELTRNSVENEAAEVVANHSKDIEKFFSQYKETAKTFVNSPYVLGFFSGKLKRNQKFTRRHGYDEIIATFESVSAKDENIKSAFFASEITGEYFFEGGRVGVDSEGPDAGDVNKGYFANKRPWYGSAVEKGQFFVSPPAVDAQDNTVSAVIQSPITHRGDW